MGVVAAGNFSITAAVLVKAAVEAARHLDHWEVLDFASAGKPDAPSGTARELAERLGEVRSPEIGLPVSDVIGPREARGASIGGSQVHSVRLPSFSVSTEVVFAAPGERLAIRQDAGESAAPYVAGTLLAVRSVVGRTGLDPGARPASLARDVDPPLGGSTEVVDPGVAEGRADDECHAADVDRVDDRVGRRVDASDGAVPLVRDPLEPVGATDAVRRLRADLDRRHDAIRRGVQARDGTVLVVGEPDRAGMRIDAEDARRT